MTVYIKNKKAEVLTSQYQREFFALKIIEKNRQNKVRQTKKDEMKEESYVNYTTVIKKAFHFLV